MDNMSIENKIMGVIAKKAMEAAIEEAKEDEEFQIKVEDLGFDHVVYKLVVNEELSQAIHIEMTVIVTHKEKKPILLVEEELLKPIKITVKLEDREKIYIGKIFNYTKYRMVSDSNRSLQWAFKFDVYHHLHSLSYFNPYRIFQKTTMHDVVYDVLRDSLTTMEGNSELLRQIPVNTYVQFGENSLNFLKRILQMHGYYFICHKDDNIIDIYNTVIGYKKADKKYDFGNLHSRHIDTISEVIMKRKTSYREYHLKNIDTTLPDKLLDTTSIYDKGVGVYREYPVLFSNDEEGHNRTESMRRKNENDNDSIDVISYIFDAEQGLVIIGNMFPEPHVITKIRHVFELPETTKTTPYNYQNTFQLIEGERSFVSPEILQKPSINGLLPAKVISPEGEKIHRNMLGYIKVRFKWNEDAKRDDELIEDKDVGWLPLCNSLASNEFGSYVTPRKDDEVLISFIGGNPDEPIVVGSMYTKTFRNFYGFEEDKSKIAFKSKSLTDLYEGSTSICINDREDLEELHIEAQKDMKILVGKREEMENNYKFTMLKGRREERILEGDYILEMVNGDYTRTIHGSEKAIIIRGDRGGDYMLTVADGRLIIEVNGDSDINITGNGKIHIARDCDIEVLGKTKIITGDTLDIISNLDMRIHSDTKIAMTAPEIEMISERTFRIASTDTGKIECLNDLRVETGSTSLISEREIRNESGGQIALVSEMDIAITSALGLNIKAGLDISFDAGLNLVQRAGLRYSLDAGMDVAFKAGLKISFDGVSVAINSILCRVDSAIPLLCDPLISKGIL